MASIDKRMEFVFDPPESAYEKGEPIHEKLKDQWFIATWIGSVSATSSTSLNIFEGNIKYSSQGRC
jgi:hypothetical protein